jgi:hypothetical protein
MMKVARPSEDQIGLVTGQEPSLQPRSQVLKCGAACPKPQCGPQIVGRKHSPALFQNLTRQPGLPGRQVVKLQNGWAHSELSADAATEQGVQQGQRQVDFLVRDEQRRGERDDVLVVAADVQDQTIGP